MQTLGPFTPAALGASNDHQALAPQSGLGIGVEIVNLSGYLLRIHIGARVQWLPAFRIDRFPLNDETGIQVFTIQQEFTNPPENQYLVTVAFANDASDYLKAFPGTYPADISRAASVSITAGTVAVTGDVSVVNTPAVTISGTPNVAISGTPTVILGAGVATIGSISAIGSTVTVAGTINIGNTPSVSISGTPTVNIGNTPAVTISSGTVAISGTVNVSITGSNTVILGGGVATIGSISSIGSTVTVAGTINIGNTPSVSISGTPSVIISSGTVNIGGTPNINIQSQSINLNTQQPQSNLGTVVVTAGGSNNGTFAIPTGTHAVGVLIQNGAGISAISVVGQQTGATYLSLPPSGATATLQGFVMSAALSAADTSVVVTASSANGATLQVIAVLAAAAEYVFNNPSQPLSVQILGATGAPLGDTGAPILAADRAVVTAIVVGNTLSSSVGVLASFKAAAGSVPALVKAGAIAVGSQVAVNPAFGQATVAGHLLVCKVMAYSADPTTAAAGWAQVVLANAGGGGMHMAIWSKPNCGAGEAAPAFTSAGVTTNMQAILEEYSGVATVTPTDQTGSSFQAIGTAPLTYSYSFANAAKDSAQGDLLLLGVCWRTSLGNSTGTFTSNFNNSAPATRVADNGGTSLVDHLVSDYGVIPIFVSALPFGEVPWDFDWQVFSLPAAGSQATVTVAAVVGKRHRCRLANFGLKSGGTAGAPNVSVLDGATGLWTECMGVIAAANTLDHTRFMDAAYIGTVNTNMIGQHSGGFTSGVESVSIAGYTRP